ncbi:MAG: hypothetical protein FWD58_07170 [Firmicutes bacterium]|nr:hypothetical protein [Bacillota bacterium]
MTITQKIISMGVIWLFFSWINLSAFRIVDKQYKLKYLLTNFYKLNKIKMLFFYYARKKGEIAKYVFWLNIVWYILSVAFLSVWVAFIIIQTKPLQLASAILVFSHIGLTVVTAGFNIYYDIRYGKPGQKNV